MVKDGVFQAMMEVELKNDGPVTIEISTDQPKTERNGSSKKINPESESSGQSEDRKTV